MVPGEDLVPACITIESRHAAQDKKDWERKGYILGRKKNRLTSVFEETSNCVWVTNKGPLCTGAARI